MTGAHKSETLSIKARLRISILALVVTIILALSALHLDGVVGETLADTVQRGQLIGDQIKTYVLETANRRAPAPGSSLSDRKRNWYQAISQDPVLPHLLERSLTHTATVVEVMVLDDSRNILVSSAPERAGQRQSGDRSVADWERSTNWQRLWDVFRSTDDYVIDLPIGSPDSLVPVLTVRAVISPVLVRSVIEPKIRELAIISGIALVMSVLLAMLVSKLFSRSLEHIGDSIDRIASGDQADSTESFTMPEMVNVQSKLLFLSKKYTGARNDMLNLRNNVDQLLANLEEAVLVFGPDGRLQMAGDPAERLLAKNRQDIIGMTLGDLFPVWTNLGRLLHEAVGTRRPLRSASATLERPNLPPLHLAVTAEWIDQDDGRTGMLLTMRNAETRKELVSQLDVARRLSSISGLMSGVAHEIKNPLNAIMLHLELAYEKIKSASPVANEEFGVIRRELQRLDRVLKTFLDFNRPIEVHFAGNDLVQLAKGIAAQFTGTAQNRSIDLQVSTELEQACINADGELLRQAAFNVVMNALEAMSGPGRLSIGVEQVAEDYVLSISDEGTGIPPEIQDKIFNLYFTTKPTATGVGLAMAYRIVQLHGGTMSFETAPGKGTCFRMHFPVQQCSGMAA